MFALFSFLQIWKRICAPLKRYIFRVISTAKRQQESKISITNTQEKHHPITSSNHQTFPIPGKNPTIILFTKLNKNPGFTQNYRAINLVRSVSNTTPKLKSKKGCEDRNIISNEQYGFRDHSIERQVFRLIEPIVKRINN